MDPSSQASTPPSWLLDPAAAMRDAAARIMDGGAALADSWGPALAVAVSAAIVLAAARRRTAARRMRAQARRVRVLAPPAPEPSGAEVLWLNLHDLLRPAWRRLLEGQPHLAWEYAWSQAGLDISVWVPAAVPPGLVERAIEAAWPAARTETLHATTPLPADAHVTAGQLRLAEPEWFPLRTDFDNDPLRPLLGAAATGDPGERVAVQVVARPATSRATRRARQAARGLRLGGRGHARAAAAGGRMDPTVGPDVRAMLDKADGPLWQVAVRYAVATTGDEQTRARPRLRGRAHAVASAFAVYSARNRFRRCRLARPNATFQRRSLTGCGLMSGRELAALAHVPTDLLVPGLPRAGARAVPPPVEVPRGGPGAKVVGDADAGPARPVALTAADGRYHVHVMGATGSGKSTLLTNLVLQDVEAHRGCVVVDPKGDLITDILRRLPPAARREAVVLDPQATGEPPALNMLEVPPGIDRELVVDHLVGIFHRIFERHWGPRTDDVLRAACLTLLETEPRPTLGDIPTLLADPHDRQFTADSLNDEGLSGFWRWYDSLPESQRAQMIGSPLSKLRAFLLRGFVRSVVDTDKPSIDMNRVLDGGLLLVRVPKGLLGEDTARLLGSFVVARVWQSTTGRAALGQTARADAALYVDECQNFMTLPNSVGDMLAEARGYHLSVVLAHQHLGQLPRELREAVSANARNKIMFTMSPEDAHILQRHVAPELTDHDLSHLGAYQVACRLVQGGQDQPAFTACTRPLPGGSR